MHGVLAQIRNFKLGRQGLTFDSRSLPNSICCQVLSPLSPQEEVRDLVLCPRIIIVVYQSGRATLHDRWTGRFVSDLLNSEYQTIKSVCYNKWNHTIFTIWHPRAGNDGLRVSIIRCRDLVPAEDTHHPHPSIPFCTHMEDLHVPYPGFVEFEGSFEASSSIWLSFDIEQSARIVTSTPQDLLYRFWDMKTYRLLFSVGNEHFKEIRLSGNFVALLQLPSPSLLRVQLQLCKTTLIFKQSGSNLRAYDLVTGVVSSIPRTSAFNPQSVTFINPESEREEGPVRFPSSSLIIKPSTSSPL
eukprot:Blabericola_migrator_1__419@NODE_1100_length_5436_cov_44_427454_g753_i0_p3_GENE_NODE_1100_length_5436_cov_44_427454_g753_i0NODE_1100_length_5436_cov_44_427454_g753_i0_p3_ORF_typecomplete_len299_score14_05_NODE_1100_length_5436_cov_44_427454_g753_i020312927